MVMKILILIFVFKIKASKITGGHNYALVKEQSRLDVRKYSPGRPSHFTPFCRSIDANIVLYLYTNIFYWLYCPLSGWVSVVHKS